MKLVSYLLLLLSVVMGISAVDVQKSFLVSFDQGASDDVVNAAKQMIKDADGQITHTYSLFKGFAATAGQKVFESLQVFAMSNGATVEEDQSFHTEGDAYLA